MDVRNTPEQRMVQPGYSKIGTPPSFSQIMQEQGSAQGGHHTGDRSVPQAPRVLSHLLQEDNTLGQGTLLQPAPGGSLQAPMMALSGDHREGQPQAPMMPSTVLHNPWLQGPHLPSPQHLFNARQPPQGNLCRTPPAHPPPDNLPFFTSPTDGPAVPQPGGEGALPVDVHRLNPHAPSAGYEARSEHPCKA